MSCPGLISAPWEPQEEKCGGLWAASGRQQSRAAGQPVCKTPKSPSRVSGSSAWDPTLGLEVGTGVPLPQLFQEALIIKSQRARLIRVLLSFKLGRWTTSVHDTHNLADEV